MDPTASVKFFNRGPSPIARLVFFSLLSILLLFVDSRQQYLESARSVLSTLIYPLQKLTTLPPLLWHEADEFFTTRGRLQRDNEQLRAQHDADATKLLQFDSLQSENAQLRAMLDMRDRLDLPMQTAEVLYTERDPSRHKLIINLGQAEVQAGQPVLDSTGVVGQVTRALPLLSEVTLITDKDHEVPVQVLRTGLRMILFGSGKANELDLRYVAASADVQDGDLLVTSGIGGTYPAGLPVARILHVERDPAYHFARIRCVPLTGVNSHHQLFVLSGLVKLPPRPEAAATLPASKLKKTRNPSK